MPSDLPGIIALCEAEGWPTLPADPERAHRILTNPGVTAFVAVEEAAVAGFIYILSDGESQAFIASMAVDATRRREGIGRSLIEHAFAVCGAERLDLLSDADEFYASFPHRTWSGFRIYPGAR
jgi:ribosomal protein S18 acetylase RimI-like enzyme